MKVETRYGETISIYQVKQDSVLDVKDMLASCTDPQSEDQQLIYAGTDLSVHQLDVATVLDDHQRGNADPLAAKLRNEVERHTNISLVDVGPFGPPTERLLVHVEIMIEVKSREHGVLTLLGAIGESLEEHVRLYSTAQIDDSLHRLGVGDEAYVQLDSQIYDEVQAVMMWRAASRYPPPPPEA